MTEITVVFYNYTSSNITLTAPGGKVLPIVPNMYISNTASTGDYIISYKSKSYPVKRSDINKIAPATSINIYIVDNIDVKEPISDSTFVSAGQTYRIGDSTDVSMFASPDQNLKITNYTGSWTQIAQPSWIVTFIVLVLILLIIIVFVGLGYITYRHIRNSY